MSRECSAKFTQPLNPGNNNTINVINAENCFELQKYKKGNLFLHDEGDQLGDDLSVGPRLEGGGPVLRLENIGSVHLEEFDNVGPELGRTLVPEVDTSYET